jgi:peptidoglycan/xylan/chitin deacetylase (PgdA/CDA1 family)
MATIPILMYHSISDNQRWLWGHLSCPVQVFEDHVRVLAENGYTAISLPDMHAHLCQGAALPQRPIVLTFDDGYLDNWVFAYPILKRYGFKGTIFVNPDFVDPTPRPRPTMDDLPTNREALTSGSTGFLSWSEMAVMQSSGVMDIQSHALTHTWHFCDRNIVDWHHPGDAYPWLAWNARPDRKHLWLSEDQATFVPFGAPIYAHERALVAHRYYPDQRLADALAEETANRGGAEFFQDPDWKTVLDARCTHYRSQGRLADRWESDHEYESRVQHELDAAKQAIEDNLRKPVRFLCWPGGGYSKSTERIAREVGYLAATLSSTDPRRSRPDTRHLVRWGAPTIMHGDRTVYRSGQYLANMVRCRQGNRWSCLKCKLLTGYDVAFSAGQAPVRSALVKILGRSGGRG